MSTPLAAQFLLTSTLKDYFNSNMVTIIIFLAILSTMLIYSLMLQDVNSKTYEYGMLRALGFKKLYLVSVISIKSLSFSVPGLPPRLSAQLLHNGCNLYVWRTVINTI